LLSDAGRHSKVGTWRFANASGGAEQCNNVAAPGGSRPSTCHVGSVWLPTLFSPLPKLARWVKEIGLAREGRFFSAPGTWRRAVVYFATLGARVFAPSSRTARLAWTWWTSGEGGGGVEGNRWSGAGLGQATQGTGCLFFRWRGPLVSFRADICSVGKTVVIRRRTERISWRIPFIFFFFLATAPKTPIGRGDPFFRGHTSSLPTVGQSADEAGKEMSTSFLASRDNAGRS